MVEHEGDLPGGTRRATVAEADTHHARARAGDAEPQLKRAASPSARLTDSALEVETAAAAARVEGELDHINPKIFLIGTTLRVG